MLRFVLFSSIFVAACEVGSIPGVTPDGSGGGDTGGDNGTACIDAVTPAAPKHTHGDDGTSKRNQACQASGCHGASPTGPAFTFSGTVSTAADGATPKPGATVRVIDGANVFTAVADEDGNFYSTQTITLPAKTNATACPTVAPMVGMIVAGGGNCNNCHSPNAGAITSPVYVQ